MNRSKPDKHVTNALLKAKAGNVPKAVEMLRETLQRGREVIVALAEPA